MLARWDEACIGAISGAAAACLVAFVMRLQTTGIDLLVNPDTVGAALGAALTIGGTLIVAQLIDARKRQAEISRQRSLLLGVLSLLQATVQKTYSYTFLGHRSQFDEVITLHEATDQLNAFRRAGDIADKSRALIANIAHGEMLAYLDIQYLIAKAEAQLASAIRGLNMRPSADGRDLAEKIDNAEQLVLSAIDRFRDALVEVQISTS